MAAAARSSGRIARRVPLKAFPTAVRTELTITASRMACLPSQLLDATQAKKSTTGGLVARATANKTSPQRRRRGGHERHQGSREAPPTPPPFYVSVGSQGPHRPRFRKWAFHGN